MKHIILDTNFILIPIQFKVDIFVELRRICDFNYEVSVLDKTITELNRITKTQPGKHKAAVRLALQLIKKNNVQTIKTATQKYVDDILVDLSKKGYIIATQDIALKRRLKRPYITLRKKQYLVLVS